MRAIRPFAVGRFAGGSLYRRIALLAIAATFALASVGPAAAYAAPKWQLKSLSATAVQPGTQVKYVLDAVNVGDQPTDGSPVTLTVQLPAGMTVASALFIRPGLGYLPDCTAANGVDSPVGGQTLHCENTVPTGTNSTQQLRLIVDVAPGASGTLTPSFLMTGGGADSSATVDPTLIGPDPGFGIEAFDGRVDADPDGAPFTQAGGHPYSISTDIRYNTYFDRRPDYDSAFPIETPKDVLVDIPPGLVGSVGDLPQCSVADLAEAAGVTPTALCPPSSQVGTITLPFESSGSQSEWILPVFNLETTLDVPARFGFNASGSVVTLNAELRSDDDYGITIATRNIPSSFNFTGASVTFWGTPSDPSHDAERACPGSAPPTGSFGGPSCGSGLPLTSILRNPTSCTDAGTGLETRLRMDSWAHPGDFAQAGFESHLPIGFPYPTSDWGAPQGPTGCGSVPFDPSLDVTATSGDADSPAGFNFDISLPQTDDPDSIGQSDLKKAVVTLPEGTAVNPSSANGLDSCSSAQIGLTTPLGSAPIHFNRSDPACPDASRVGTVSIDTPLLPNPVQGSVYLAAQDDNPFQSLLSIYIVAKGPGVIIKLPGKVNPHPDTGQLRATFDNNPQLPFSNLNVKFFSGDRSPLQTPPSCGVYTVSADFYPWSNPGAPAHRESSFRVDRGPSGGPCPNGGFDPSFSAGTVSPIAGSYSPFVLKLSRKNGSQRFAGLETTLPEGLLGKLAGVEECSEARLAAAAARVNPGAGALEQASPSCPQASEVGVINVGAGVGAPLYVQGHAYLAGPYKGAPLSLAIITPAVAGPFDLGTVVVRAALYVDSTSAQITVKSDPLPTILQGIPLDIRSIAVNVNRSSFTLNPTDCGLKKVGGQSVSTTGQVAPLNNRFQVGGCKGLDFQPKLALSLKGGTRRSGHPALRAQLTMPNGGANIASTSVALPHSEFLAQDHIRTVCTRVQFNAGAGNGAGCPKGSIYGRATATTPLLTQPLSGPVYLRSSSHPLPDLVVALHGQVDLALVGRIDSKNGGIRTTFENVPDAPVSKFVLSMQGGKKGLLENSTNLCRSTNRARIALEAQNGKRAELKPALKSSCSRERKGEKGAKRHGQR